MTTDVEKKHQITINGLTVEVVRKAIKNLHLGVYPPYGRVRVAAPLAISDDAVRLAVIGKLGWIKRQRVKFETQPRQSEREMVNGESHYFMGRRYRLRIVEHKGAGLVVLRNKAMIDLHVRLDATTEQREEILLQWHRKELKALVPTLLEKWQPVIGVQAASWGVKKMKTKWGSCNIDAGRIWLNLELAKKPIQCLEYIIVHELVHLVERHHNERFAALMDAHIPQWRQYRAILSTMPLGHETWDY